MGFVADLNPAADGTTLASAVAAAVAQYTAHNPKSAAAHAEACKHLPGGNTRTVLHTPPFPLTFSQGQGTTLTTADGADLTDYLGEYTAGIYGHSHPAIRAAVEGALARGWNYGGHSGLEAKLAAAVCERFRPAMEMLRFVNSGTEANMLALATACAYTVSPLLSSSSFYLDPTPDFLSLS